MDRETRNRIQHATQAARELLEHEYAEQLDGVFDIGLDGTISAVPGEHLDAAQCVLWTKLVTAVEHQRASGLMSADAVGGLPSEGCIHDVEPLRRTEDARGAGTRAGVHQSRRPIRRI